jgi:hypothetical protein
MPLVYPIKRMFRSWKLFVALLIGVIFASTFFAGLNVKANLVAKQMMEEQLTGIYTDIQFNTFLNYSHPAAAKPYILGVDSVTDVEYFYRSQQPSLVQSDNFTNTQFIQTAAVPNSSSLYTGLMGIPPEGLGENETYILYTSMEDPYKSPLQQLEVGDVIQTALQFQTANWSNTTDIHLNLTVAGFVKLTDEAYSKISGNSFYISPMIRSYPGQSFGFMDDLMFVS